MAITCAFIPHCPCRFLGELQTTASLCYQHHHDHHAAAAAKGSLNFAPFAIRRTLFFHPKTNKHLPLHPSIQLPAESSALVLLSVHHRCRCCELRDAHQAHPLPPLGALPAFQQCECLGDPQEEAPSRMGSKPDYVRGEPAGFCGALWRCNLDGKRAVSA